MTDRQPILLLASYCGGDNPECSDNHPCIECLKMSNVAWATVADLNVVGGWESTNGSDVESFRLGETSSGKEE